MSQKLTHLAVKCLLDSSLWTCSFLQIFCGYVSISRPLSFCWWWLKAHLGNLSGTLKGQLESNIYLGEFLSLDSRPLRTDFFFSAKLSQLYFLASIPTPTRFSFVFFFFQNAFYSRQARNSAVQIGLSQYLPETYHFSSVVLHIFFLISLPSSLQTYYTNIIELILQRLG